MRVSYILTAAGTAALVAGVFWSGGPSTHPALSSLALMTFAVAAFSTRVR